MAYTYTSGPYNSTPFSSCCRTASITSSGKPDDHCHKCGRQMTHHDDGLNDIRRKTKPGHCLMCGKKIGNPAISGNRNC